VARTNLDKWVTRKGSVPQRSASAVDAAFGDSELSVAAGREWKTIEELIATSDEDAVYAVFDE
jgi:hypothetical protein